MSEKLPDQENSIDSGASPEALPLTTQEETGASRGSEGIPANAPELQDSERRQALAEIKASISAEGGKAAAGTTAAVAGATTSAAEVKKGDDSANAGKGGMGRWGGMIKKSLKFVGNFFAFGFGLLVVAGASALEQLSKIKFKGGALSAGGSHKKQSKGHAAPKSGGGHSGGGSHGASSHHH